MKISLALLLFVVVSLYGQDSEIRVQPGQTIPLSTNLVVVDDSTGKKLVRCATWTKDEPVTISHCELLPGATLDEVVTTFTRYQIACDKKKGGKHP